MATVLPFPFAAVREEVLARRPARQAFGSYVVRTGAFPLYTYTMQVPAPLRVFAPAVVKWTEEQRYDAERQTLARAPPHTLPGASALLAPCCGLSGRQGSERPCCLMSRWSEPQR